MYIIRIRLFNNVTLHAYTHVQYLTLLSLHTMMGAKLQGDSHSK